MRWRGIEIRHDSGMDIYFFSLPIDDPEYIGESQRSLEDAKTRIDLFFAGGNAAHRRTQNPELDKGASE